MRLAISNIALPEGWHVAHFSKLRDMGFEGVEVASSRVWPDQDDAPPAAEIEAYRRSLEAAGLTATGLHSLFYMRRELSIFSLGSARAATCDFLRDCSALCRDLGGRYLVLGSPGARARNGLPMAEAWMRAVSLFQEVSETCAKHGVAICLEPLGPADTDFVNTSAEAARFAADVGHAGAQLQLDAKALAQNQEEVGASIAAVADRIRHFHANEEDLGVLGRAPAAEAVDHAAIGRALRDIGYQGFVTAEQRMLAAESVLEDAEASAKVMRRAYLGQAA